MIQHPFCLCYNPCSCIQVIIPHEVGVPGLKRVPILVFLLPLSLLWLSCGGSSSSGSKSSGLAYRAFISNSVTAAGASAGVYIVNALADTRGSVAPISAGNSPGIMVVTPNLAQTLVFSGNGTQFSDNQFTIIENSTESAASHVSLPGMTYSFVVSPDSSTAYVALPTAPVTGQPAPGAIEVINLSTGVTAEISCPPVNPTPPLCAWPSTVPQGFNQPYQFLAMGNTGTRLLAFSQGADSVADTIAVITPSNVATDYPVISFVPGFDHPVAAFFTSDDTSAYVLNCGAECGGQQASIQTLDLTTLTAGPPGVACTPGGNPSCIGTLNLTAGSVALVNGSTMYIAGTPPFIGGVPQQPCTGETTAAQSCGLLTIVDLSTMTVTNSGIVITDGYHNQIALGPNGQLFIGARTCTEIVPPIPPPPGAETRGCLSIYNTLTTTVGAVSPGGVTIPNRNGDATGIQPIARRQVVYVVQGGSLWIYDATIDALEYNPSNPLNPGEVNGLVGYFIDVKTVDF